MKTKYIIFPVVMTDAVCGYSAMGIEMTEANLNEINKYISIFKSSVEKHKYITEIVFGNTPIDIHFFNQDFQHDDTLKIEDLSDDEVVIYTEQPEDEDSEVDAPVIVITADYFSIKSNSKHGIGELYSNNFICNLDGLIKNSK